jgi:hypothetical protein
LSSARGMQFCAATAIDELKWCLDAIDGMRPKSGRSTFRDIDVARDGYPGNGPLGRGTEAGAGTSGVLGSKEQPPASAAERGSHAGVLAPTKALQVRRETRLHRIVSPMLVRRRRRAPTARVDRSANAGPPTEAPGGRRFAPFCCLAT